MNNTVKTAAILSIHTTMLRCSSANLNSEIRSDTVSASTDKGSLPTASRQDGISLVEIDEYTKASDGVLMPDSDTLCRVRLARRSRCDARPPDRNYLSKPKK